MLTTVPMSREWLEERARALGEGAYLFIEGYEWTGIAIWRNQAFDFPVDFSWRLNECSDIRLFGKPGEWHCVRFGEEWKTRWAKASDWEKRLVREHVVWGRKLEAEAKHGWWRLTEANGVAISLPFEPNADVRKNPVRLVVWHRVACSDATGQAFVQDAMLRDVIQELAQ